MSDFSSQLLMVAGSLGLVQEKKEYTDVFDIDNALAQMRNLYAHFWVFQSTW